MTKFQQRAERPVESTRGKPSRDVQDPVAAQPDGIGEILQLQRMVGNRATVQLLQRRIANKTLTINATKKHGVTYLKQQIGSYDATGRGTGPAKGEPSNMNNVGPIDGRYVGGHMFNQDLGGLGRWDNMIVQSEDSNKKMNKHDNIIKRLANHALRNETYARNGYEYGIIEEITVHAATPDGSIAYKSAPLGANERYTGEQHVPSGLTVTIKPVKQQVGQPATRVAWGATGSDGHNEAIDAKYDVTNVPPYPPLVATGSRRSKIGGKKTGKKTPGVAPVKMAGKAHLHTARLKLKNKLANTLTKADFLTVPFIGDKGASALVAYFAKKNVPLATLVNSTKLRKYGLTKIHISALMYEGVV